MHSYKIANVDESSVAGFTDFVVRNDVFFTPPLSQRVALHEYITKLLEKARNYILLVDEQIACAVSCYVNGNEYAFITMVLTDHRFKGKGYAKILLNHVLADISKSGYYEVRLEVNKENKAAISLYKNLGFFILETNKDVYHIMTLVSNDK
ncbi:GNAT family N-acetyltransferase [Citrobacter freundii]|uniref:GNAT family N-acetyltransferase n=1 Tax=Citrobacter TaxID=544 RepID=UPI0005CCCB57|nr:MULTISPECIES: GNAT family N-acetyltransferase [Citrobacter]EIX7372134.1 GNAT family N-acetyltransferase [Citrobacter freundii]EKU2551333.1 GNAT family N-acetyltransferase [Citrobacter freundii]KJC10533.1 hypothetical protein TO64_03395 [Citrobacter freundii]MBJ9855507.1 GNAT family N-acetyltransferase [Citrobacter freundii]MBM7203432.1 GNAT family N-acetyltransferase [Citrobacter freundii]